MGVVLGKDVYIYNGSSGTQAIVAAAKSCKVRMSVDLIEKASATQQSAKEYVTGRTEWGVSLNHLVTTTSPFDGIVKVGQTYTLRIVIGSTAMTGQAICTAAEITATVGNLSTGNIEFKGSGALL
jgi:hypothetical protein